MFLRSTRNLFYWIFVPVVQKALDEFRQYWNQHKIRPQEAKYMPSGHVPIDALEHPELLGGTNCLIPVPPHITDKFRQHLAENNDIGPRNTCLEFYPPEFTILADSAYNAIGCPSTDLANAWDIFLKMSNMLDM